MSPLRSQILMSRGLKFILDLGASGDVEHLAWAWLCSPELWEEYGCRDPNPSANLCLFLGFPVALTGQVL